MDRLLTRPVTAEEARVLWPAVGSAHLVASAEALVALAAADPWRLRVTGRGEALLLARWRDHLDVLAIRGLWAATQRIPALVSDALTLAIEHGFARVSSPLVSEPMLAAYRLAGLTDVEPILALQAPVASVRAALRAAPPLPATLVTRPAHAEDLATLLAIDAASFDDFWRYGPAELTAALAEESVFVAENAGALLGYLTAALHGRTLTIGRLAVAPAARRRGIGRALLGCAAAHGADRGARGLTLCTQEANAASRALYTRAGFGEQGERYAIARGRAR